jgi:hypothetical protein
MLHRLRRHPLPIATHFRHSLVLTYAFAAERLEPLLAPGLVLDRHGELGFAAAAFVQTERLRPAFAPPALGRDYFLAGYRLFVRVAAAESLRGLLILRSDTDSRALALGGNLLTRYHYKVAHVELEEPPGRLELRVRTAGGAADVDVAAELEPAPLPAGSPFSDLREARRYAGPLPYTFDYEQATDSLVVVRGTRTEWNPESVAVTVRRMTFFERPPFDGAGALANAFHVGDLDYRWERGRLLRVGSADVHKLYS